MRHLKKFLCAALAAFMMLVGTSCEDLGYILFDDDTTETPETDTDPSEITDPGSGEVTIPGEYPTEEKTTEEETTRCVHIYGEWSITEPAFCTEIGLQVRVCELCGDEQQETIPPTGHTEVIDSAVDASCTESGLTEGEHCSVCNKVLVEQKIIPAKGHTWGEWVVDKEPDLRFDGSKHTICTVCGETYTKKITPVSFEITRDNRNRIGYTGADGEKLVIPAVFRDEDTWYRVTSIGNSAFSKCVNLTNIDIPSSITSIGHRAFEHCTSLTNISFGVNSQLTYVGDYAFAWCQNLISVTIPVGVTEIKEWAFSGCEKIEAVYYEGSMDQWCSIAFENFGSNPLSDYRNYAYLYIDNKKVEGEISPSVYNDFAFSDYSYLTSIILPDEVTAIVDYAFPNCINMTSIVIPSSVTRIEDNAFYGNTPIRDIFYMGTEAEWEAITKEETNLGIHTDYTVHFNYVP